ncbi:6,7-dimethyl-8-ribityllumazine synthase [Paeniglutamicibacter gangotriensis]|uniref:6,7-dimethyl-8-ribityllumazine synthase n=2 Tax=Paeniglutamicibacter gangotriensis TaxID=254787 RepID=M7MPX8_9MICC|nr:6,7-dimethyl-8-ribityllumazine synthase [Paeniglutamicibacter gangotriensis]EMQ96995.1 6,7-dimethyl-8-ribityllumazine synthase [Paeniglutamicibacter gangotriensis Lz1y]KAA0979785.1 6,7-dimethyl-8-ribityllumazine synthase [Paeniglutamicibacter gangotriensis]
MSGHGAPLVGANELAAAGEAGVRAVIVAASWHTQIMDGLVDGALRAAADAGIKTPEVIRVPGTFELPVAASRLAHSFDTVIALGVVIRGGTPHFDFVCQGATMGLTDVSVRTGVPVGFGVLTCDTEEQAIARAGLEGSVEDKGYEAMSAGLQTALVLARR